MGVKTIEMVSIEAKRFVKREEKITQLRVDSNSTVTMITVLNDKEANIEFRFVTSYGYVGNITICGKLIYLGDAYDLEHRWKSTSNMPNEIASEIHTAIMQACIPEAVIIAKEINLPPPIPLPKVMFEKKAPGKPGGPEVA